MALIDSCVNYWKLDDSLDDEVGGNDLVIEDGDPGYGTGKINNGAALDGNDTLVTTSTVSEIGGTDDFTIAWWGNASSSGYWQGMIGDEAAIDECDCYWHGGDVRTYFDGANFDGSPGMSTGTFYHFMYIRSGSDIRMYVNNTSVANTTDSDAITAGKFILGTSGTQSNFFTGTIDEVGIFDAALDSDERAALYNSGDGEQYPFGAAAGTNIKINVGDVWKEVGTLQINIGDSWKTVAAAKINQGDAWKVIF